MARGEYLARAGGCAGCHTDTAKGAPAFAGGRALKTPFGVFHTPNITPDRQTGIGAWSDDDFVRALHEGRAPDGGHYYPAFPYTSYTRMSREDALAIKAYLFSLPPVKRANKDHDLRFPYSMRFLNGVWKLLFFSEERFQPDPARSGQWNRGAYLVRALAHCGECHTPRNGLGALQDDMAMAGTADGPDGELVPNITPDDETGIGDWSEGDLASLLKTGFKPDFDNVQGSMAEAIEHGLKYLTDEDRRAIAAYILALPPVSHKVERSQ
jgi:mono/diheme cytochrome c family protein